MNLRLYNAMTRIAGILNTCTFVDGVCEAGREGCCVSCPSLQGGCQRNSLVCKLWVCEIRRDNLSPEQLYELETLWQMGMARDFMMFRGEPTDPKTPTMWRTGSCVQSPMGELSYMPESWWAYPRDEELLTYKDGYNQGFDAGYDHAVEEGDVPMDVA